MRSRLDAARDDAGSAVIEFVVLAVLLLVPLVYLVLVLGRLQAGAFAVQSAAGGAARAAAGAPTAASAEALVRSTVDLAARDQGFPAGAATSTTACSATPCLTPGARLQVTVRLDVDLPGIPALLADVVPTHVVMESTATRAVDRFAPLAAAASVVASPGAAP